MKTKDGKIVKLKSLRILPKNHSKQEVHLTSTTPTHLTTIGINVDIFIAHPMLK